MCDGIDVELSHGLSHPVTDTLTHGKPMTSSEARLSFPST